MASDAPIDLDELTALLAPSLGARAREVVQGALDSLAIAGGAISVRDAIRVLEALGQDPSIPASVLRFAQARLSLRDTSATLRRPTFAKPVPAAKSAGLTAADLAALLAPTLGQEKSDELVAETLPKFSRGFDDVSVADGLAVFEELAKSSGIVGIASRFAKARLLMRKS